MHGSDGLGQGCSRVGLRSVLKQGMFTQRLSVIHIKNGFGCNKQPGSYFAFLKFLPHFDSVVLCQNALCKHKISRQKVVLC